MTAPRYAVGMTAFPMTARGALRVTACPRAGGLGLFGFPETTAESARAPEPAPSSSFRRASFREGARLSRLPRARARARSLVRRGDLRSAQRAGQPRPWLRL